MAVLWFICDTLCERLAFLFCLAFSFTLYVLLPSPLSNIFEFGGDGGIIFPVVLVYSSLYLISLSEPGSIQGASCALFVGLVWEMKVVEIAAQGLSVSS